MIIPCTHIGYYYKDCFKEIVSHFPVQCIQPDTIVCTDAQIPLGTVFLNGRMLYSIKVQYDFHMMFSLGTVYDLQYLLLQNQFFLPVAKGKRVTV